MEGMSAWASKPSLDLDAVGEGAETGGDEARSNVPACVAGTFCMLIYVCVRVVCVPVCVHACVFIACRASCAILCANNVMPGGEDP